MEEDIERKQRREREARLLSRALAPGGPAVVLFRPFLPADMREVLYSPSLRNGGFSAVHFSVPQEIRQFHNGSVDENFEESPGASVALWRVVGTEASDVIYYSKLFSQSETAKQLTLRDCGQISHYMNYLEQSLQNVERLQDDGRVAAMNERRASEGDRLNLLRDMVGQGLNTPDDNGITPTGAFNMAVSHMRNEYGQALEEDLSNGRVLVIDLRHAGLPLDPAFYAELRKQRPNDFLELDFGRPVPQIPPKPVKLLPEAGSINMGRIEPMFDEEPAQEKRSRPQPAPSSKLIPE